MSRQDADILITYVLERLRTRQTWATALVVGTFINLYGHALVPWLRGADPVADFFAEMQTAPALCVFSVTLGYAFPVLVGVYSSVATRWAARHRETLALFPDQKPDPVFRIDADGQIAEAGERTRVLFDAHGVRHATDIVGDEVWETLRLARQFDGAVPEGTVVYFAPTRQWFLVASSHAPDAHLNVYLTSIPAGLAGGPATRTEAVGRRGHG